MKQEQTLTEIVNLCDLKKAAAMLFSEDIEAAIRQYPACIIDCEGYNKGCPRYEVKNERTK